MNETIRLLRRRRSLAPANLTEPGPSPAEVAEAIGLVKQTNALGASSDLAEEYANKALLDLEVLKPSEYKEALKALTKAVLDRKN